MDKAFFELYYQTYNQEDPDALSQFYHDDVVLSSSQGNQVGIDELLDTYRFLISAFHDQMTPTSIRIEGNIGIIEIVDRFTAKHDVKDFLGVSLSQGVSVELRLRGTYECIDNKFKHIKIETL